MEFRHPKYYKELRKRNKALRSCDAYSKENSNYTKRQQSDQVISLIKPDGENESVHPGPGLKPEATSDKLPGPRPISNANKGLIHKRQASSDKPQASSKPEPVLVQQSSSNKRQA